ncbi:hypothetical protein KR018_002171, partial [Drosophila ironensis]
PRLYRHMFKVIVLGDLGVGKSSLLTRFSDDRFVSSHDATVGMDFKLVTVEVDGFPAKLQIWDAGDDERYWAILLAYFHGAHGVLLVYDTTSMESFRNLNSWLIEIDRHCQEKVCVQLVGTKCDDPDNRVVSAAMGAQYAKDCGLGFREASAQSGINVDDIFLSLVRDIYDTLVIDRPPPGRLVSGWEAILKDDWEESQE